MLAGTAAGTEVSMVARGDPPTGPRTPAASEAVPHENAFRPCRPVSKNCNGLWLPNRSPDGILPASQCLSFPFRALRRMTKCRPAVDDPISHPG